MTARRSKAPPDARTLPTSRVKARDQLDAVLALARLSTPSTANDICTNVGVNPNRLALAFTWLVAIGLIERTDRRGVYRATPAAHELVSAYDVDREHGYAVLRSSLATTWFASAAARRLAEGRALRDGLVAELIRAAKCADDRRLEVETLIDWLELAEMLETEDGWVTWRDPAAPMREVEPNATPLVESAEPLVEEQTPDPEPPLIPGQRTSESEAAMELLDVIHDLTTPRFSRADLLALSLSPTRLAEVQAQAKTLVATLRSLKKGEAPLHDHQL